MPNELTGNYFDRADVVVLPYTSATNSGIIQIAFGFNKPVIVTNVGGLPEAVTDNKTGFVVEPENAKSIANAVIRFYKENKAKTFIGNIKKNSSVFSWNRIVETIESFK